ncbi:type II toxin-antitoxin system RelE/ParE family toxin [Candidatus Gottesmanbacteria bacterium]|nr:type II toxin-antitoxin system RelE/ParE family toxin [Candidatus Gottesmanbacteria bacterium]
MDIVYKDEAIKALKKLGSADKTKAKKKIAALLTDPLLGKPLQGMLAGIRSIKVWPIRILYTFNSDTQTITIRAIGHRGDVYKG